MVKISFRKPRTVLATLGLFAFCMQAALAHHAPVVIDGTINDGPGEEWDGDFIGTSVTAWQGGMAVDVWGFVDGGFLYTAYRADISQPGWADACTLSVDGNFYHKTPDSASFPEEGYTILEMFFPRVMQTDGAGWNDIGTLPDNGIESGYVGMFSTTQSACADGSAGNHEAEFKIPLDLLTYAGDDGQIRLFGQYWQFEFSSEPLFVDIQAPGPPAPIPAVGIAGLLLLGTSLALAAAVVLMRTSR